MILSYLESVVSLVYHDVAHHCCWKDNRYKLLLFLSKTSFYIQINTRVFQLLSSRSLLGKFIMELRLNITKTKEIWCSDFLDPDPNQSAYSAIIGCKLMHNGCFCLLTLTGPLYRPVPLFQVSKSLTYCL